MSRVKNLIQMLSGCDKPEFDKVVKSYLKDIYGFSRIVLTDGKDDTGIDIKVFDSGNQKIQYQVTVQKSDNPSKTAQLKSKIFDDVAKAKENAENYEYSNTLIFFYSYEITNKIQREYKKEALINYNINLEIVDANQIAEESENYLNLQKAIYETSGLQEFHLKTNLFENKEQNLIYDMISFGTTADIKLTIVETFIFTYLYEKIELPKDDIVKECIAKFNSKENPEFYDKLINKLYSTKKQLSYDKSTKKYAISNDMRNIIEKATGQIKLDEQVFLKQTSDVLKVYNQESFLDEYVQLMRTFYIENFCKRINFTTDIESLNVDELRSYSTSKLKSQEKAKELSIELLKVCDDNNYLQRVCASDIFSSKINIDCLQKYAEERKFVYVDTTIVLYLLCRYSTNFKSKTSWSYYYNLSSHLMDFCKKNKVQLNIVDRYVWEVGNHIQEAINLIPFTKLENFNSLGKSKNVFYNFFCFLKEFHGDTRSFSEYMEDFKFDSNDYKIINEYIELYLSEIGIKIIKIPKEYKIENTIKIIGTQLSSSNRNKSKFALHNDAIMIEYLGDKDSTVHPVDPVFITWDRTLFAVLPAFYKANPNSQRWLQFTASQFIDRYSLLSFSIDETTISKNMLSILSNDFVDQTYSLLDSLSLILNLNNEVGLEYTNRFIKMKDSLIYTTSKESDEPQEESSENILDKVVFNITSHYREDSIKYSGIKQLFSNKDSIDAVIELIEKTIIDYKKSNSFNKDVFTEFDKMINAFEIV